MVEGVNNFNLASSSRFADKDTDDVPPIVLYNKPKQFVMAASKDGFDKQTPEDKPLMLLDANDKFVLSKENENPKSLSVNKYGNVGAKFNPKEGKKFGEEFLKWCKRAWAGLEIYDTIDGYKERLSKDKDIQ